MSKFEHMHPLRLRCMIHVYADPRDSLPMMRRPVAAHERPDQVLAFYRKMLPGYLLTLTSD